MLSPHCLLCILIATVEVVTAQTPCEKLKSLDLPETVITGADVVPPRMLRSRDTSPTSPGSMIPGFCRVGITMKPSADSDIKAEIWLPSLSAWNGKLLAEGGGGFVGTINVGAMTLAIREGYATASTDTGHSGQNPKFALGHPEKITDFAYRAVHEMTVKAKAIIPSYYGRPQQFAYWQGCSTGGRQGLMEAERYPLDYDGIIAGAPANNQIQLAAWRLFVMAAALKDPARALPPEKTALINNVVLRACGAADGVRDGFLNDPRKCHFDPATLLCHGSQQDGCLTAPQLDEVRMAYSEVKTSKGNLIYPGLPFGGETGWSIPGNATEPGSIDLGLFRYIAHQDENWDWRNFDLDRDTALAEERAGFMEATNPDLSAFKAHGGKLLIYHGWSDGGSGGAISPLNTVLYYSNVLAKMGNRQGGWLRLFMVPGMMHCGGGPGPNQFDAVAALDRWRDSGTPPESILAIHTTDNRVDMTRPLCPYPQVAGYLGKGSTDDAGSFACRNP